jgi:hypothetical protein
MFFPITLPLVPGRATTYRMPLTRAAAEEVLSLVYAVSGRDGVEIVVDSARPNRTVGAPRLAAMRAFDLLVEVAVEQQWLVVEALNEVELETRDVFLEILEGARGATQLSVHGMLEASRGFAGPPLVDLSPLRDGGATYRVLRAAVLELDAAARTLHGAEEAVQGERVRTFFIALSHLVDLVSGRIPSADELRSETPLAEENLRLAATAYAATLTRHAERFPALIMVAGTIVAATTAWPRPDLEALGADTSSYDNRLDRVIRTAVGDVCRSTWEDGPPLARRLLEEADAVVRRASFRGLAFPIEATYADHPLWRYPVIVHTALERLGYGPGTLPHAAATHVVRRASEAAARRSREERAQSRALDWANFGFGVLAFVPLVGQLAVAGAFAISLTQAVQAASAFNEAREEARAFGPFAADLGVTDPEGAGWIMFSFVGLTFDVIPVFRACSQLAGRLVRLTALPRPSAPGLLDVTVLTANLLALVIAEEAAAAGVQDPG